MNDEMINDEDVADNVDETDKPQAEIKPPAPQTGPPQAPIALSADGQLMPKDSSEEFRVASMFMQSGAVPKVFTSAPQVMMAMQFLKRFGMDPIVCIRQCCIVNGSLSIWGELPLGIVKKSGKLESIREIVYDSQYHEICVDNKNLGEEPWGATCIIKMQGIEVIERSFTRVDAERANLWTKNIWRLYPKRMLQMRARGWALKDAAPEIISGISILEYDHGTIPDANGFPMPLQSNTMDKMKLMMTAKGGLVDKPE